jgi:NADH dehydrogenase
MAALVSDAAPGRVFELGGPRVYTFRQLMRLVLSEIGRQRMLMPVPLGLAGLAGWFLQKLPDPLFTRDQMLLLRRDNVVADGTAGLADLGIVPIAAEAVLPGYLRRFRRPQLRMPHAA